MDDQNVNAGDLNRRVYYQSASDGTADELGTVPTEYDEPGVGYWAQIRNLTGRETYFAQQTEALADKVIVTRYPGFVFDPRGRFVFGSRIFNISWVDNPDDAKRMIRSYVTESVEPAEGV
jgi:SPP1 family predicted phage head-tail adaptor